MSAYVISEVTIRDQEAVARYKPVAKRSVLAFGGQYLARDVAPETLEGAFAPDERIVILSFPDTQAARAWYASDAYAEALSLAGDALDRRLFIVEGA